jgi:Family of unknown function (DUF6345)
MTINLNVRVGSEWVDHFHDDGCNQGNRDYNDDHADGFYAHMGNHGHTRVFEWGEDNAWESDFRHPDFGGDSLNWSDNVNFCYFADHGGNWDNVMHIAFAKAHDNCLGASNQWRLGARMLKWFVLDCCDAVLNTDPNHIASVWFGPMQGVHLVFGFVGNSHDSWWTSGHGADFGDSAGTGGRLANSWLDAAYSFWTDDNPIAIAAGVNRDDAINRRENETINWRDANIAGTNWLAWKWRS